MMRGVVGKWNIVFHARTEHWPMSSYAPPPPTQWDPPRPAAEQRSNGVATGGFVVALIGAIFSVIPAIGVVAWVLAPLGLVLSIVGLLRAHQLGSRKLAIAGTVLGAIGLLICFVWAAVFFASLGHTTSSTTSVTRPSYSTPYVPAAPQYTAAPDASSSTSTVDGFSQGTYEVGTGTGQIAPGKYRTTGAPSSELFQFCMASREKSDGSTIGFPVTTNTGPAFVTVQSSDGMVELSGPCTWAKVS
ncbi:MAG: hypothetical protein QOE59_1008 [Actinomycetota bacterium]|nr:hypothetical protein [Actinomycetota bacterium]